MASTASLLAGARFIARIGTRLSLGPIAPLSVGARLVARFGARLSRDESRSHGSILPGFLEHLRSLIRRIVRWIHTPHSAHHRGKRIAPLDRHNHRYSTQKPEWLKTEIIRLKALMPQAGCRSIADLCNRRFAASRKVTVGKTYVHQILQQHDYEIQILRRNLKHAKPKPVPRNLIWGIDLTGKTDSQGYLHFLFGIIDHGSRALLHLQVLHEKTSHTLLTCLLEVIRTHGKPKIIRTDNEAIFTSRKFCLGLKKLGIRHQLDGVSQAGELKTLAELGIESFNVASINHSQLLANGNQIADTGTYTKTDGSTGTAGVTAGMADINLAVDTFHRTFADVIPTTVDTAALPDMQGSGAVRDLREAASIQSAEGATLASALGQFAQTTTRNEQRAQLDALLTDWAATAAFPDMATQAAEHGYTLATNLSPAWQQKLHLLETFNGRSFYHMPWDTTNAQSGVTGMSVTHDASGDHISISMNGTQLALLDQAYSALKESVYDALVVQRMVAANDVVFEVRRVCHGQ